MIKIKEMLRYFRGFPKIIFWKFRYGKKLNVSYKQNFRKRVKIHMSGNAEINIEEGLSNRDGLTIKAEDGKLHIGKNCFFNINCSITCVDEIHIGDNCLFANNVVVVDHDHDYKKMEGLKKSSISIGNNVWIGANCVILRGTHIGDNCVVGAGTVLSGRYESDTKIIQSRKLEVSKIER